MLRYKVEIVRGINKGRILTLDEEKAEEFVRAERVRIIKVLTADAPPEETPDYVEVAAEPVVEQPAEEPVLTPEAEGDDLEEEERCEAFTKSGTRCKRGKCDGQYCGVHAPKEE